MRNRKARIARWPAVLVGTLALVAATGPAHAMSMALDVELDDALLGTFATVHVVENAGALDFLIALDASLGPDADIHEFYFNILSTDITGVDIATHDAVQTDYTLEMDPSVNGGAGSSFDYGVNFGNGAGSRGNGNLQTASFSIFADQNLTVAQLNEFSQAQGGTIDLNFALHVQSTWLVQGATSETIGGLIHELPEPSAGALLALGLGGLARKHRRERAAG